MPLPAALLAALLLVALGIGTVSALGGDAGPGASPALNGASAEVSIETMTNGQDADTPPGPVILPGSPVIWTYVVTNTGSVALTNVQITDDQGVVVTAPKTDLLPGESMTATAAGTAQDGQYANVGTVTAELPDGTPVTASDPSHYLGGAVAPPVANFTANATEGLAPLAVQFADASAGSPTLWAWEFGDGETSTAQHPVHVYTLPGTYAVNLTVTNPGGSDSEAKAVYVRVIQAAPAIDLALAVSADNGTTWHDADTAPGPNLPLTGAAFQFRYVVTNVGNVPLTDCAIGGVAAIGPLEPGASFTVQRNGSWAAGQQAVSATAYGYYGLRAFTAPDTVYYIGVAPPVANFEANVTAGTVPLSVQFTDTSTGDGITAWSWEFGDGETSTAERPVHVYTAPGNYTVNLTVTDVGGSDSETKPGYVTVLQDTPPVGGNKAYFLVSTAPAGAEVYLEARDGTRHLKGDTSAGPLNMTLYLTAIPMRRVVAVLPGYLEAAWEIGSYPAAGEIVPVHLVLEPGTGGPFPAPHVPATVIQAEDYDAGGEGAAYHDLEPRNLGGAYRPAEGVDVETVNGVTNVGWIRSGEYLKYTIDTTIAGRFTLVLRAANPGPAQKQVAVLLDGAPVTEVDVGSTGGWTTYAEFAGIEPLYLGAGRHTVTLDFAGTDRVNLDWLRLAAGTVPAGGGQTYPSAHAVPGRVEAEDYDVGGFSDTTAANEGGAYRADAVDIERGGSGYDVGWIRPGEYLQYSVDAATAGTYAVAFRVANPGGPKPVTVLVSGGAHLLTVPATGSFGAWQTVTLSGVPLAAGRNTVRVETGRASSFNLDYLEFSTGPAATTTMPGGAGGASFMAAPLSSRAGAAVTFAVTPAAGKTIRSAWWSFDAPAHLSTWNSRAINPTFFYPRAGTFSPLVKLTYTDGSTETVHRADYVRAT